MSDLSFYVIEAVPSPGAPAAVASMPGQGPQLHTVQSIRQWFGAQAKEIPADKLLSSFGKTMAVIDAMLAGLTASEKRGYLLNEFEVTLGVSGEGTIGFMTASVESSVVLKFKRVGVADQATA